MRQIEIKGKKYDIEWNLMSQMMLEGLNETWRSMLDTKQDKHTGVFVPVRPVGFRAVITWAALCGGSDNFEHTPDWVLRQLGSDMRALEGIMAAVNAEIDDYRKFNDVRPIEGNAPAPEMTSGAKN